MELPARKGPWMPTLMGALAQVAQQSQGRCWALVVTPGNDGLKPVFQCVPARESPAASAVRLRQALPGFLPRR